MRETTGKASGGEHGRADAGMNVKFRFIFENYGIVIPLVIVFIGLSIITKGFIDGKNLINILRQISFLSIVSIGSTFVIISGGIDLSVGSIMGLVAVFSTIWVKSGGNLFWMLVIALITGLAVGVVNGILIANFTIPPFIVTLATMIAGRGVILLITRGYNISGLDCDKFLFFGRGYIGSVPFPVIIMVVVYAIFMLYMGGSRFGRYIYAIGNNESASRVAGIAVKKVKILVYMIAGLTGAIGSVILVSRMNLATPMFCSGIEFDCITAVVLGGTAITGGRGKLINTLMGATLLGIVNNGFNLMGISSYWASVAKGFILIIAIIIYNLRVTKK